MQLETDGPPPDQVAVLTVHRAKGLEFKIVYLCGLLDGRFPVQVRSPLLALPDELTSSIDNTIPLAEERRLFYVAMTRARDELWLSYHVGGRGTRRPSPFISEAIDEPALAAAAQSTIGLRSAVEQIEERLTPSPLPVIPPRAMDGPCRSATRRSTSISAVRSATGCVTWSDCRRRPTTRSRMAARCTRPSPRSMCRKHDGAPLGEADLLAELDRHWVPDGYLSREHEEARYAAGREALLRFRARELASGAVPAAIERPFRFRLGQDQIVGRVDRLDSGPEGVVITDYKSSDVREQKRADTRARDSLQLQVYALAHQAETGQLPNRVQLHFIDTGVVGSAVPDDGPTGQGAPEADQCRRRHTCRRFQAAAQPPRVRLLPVP